MLDKVGRKRYDWSAVQRYHDAGHGRDECMRRFGFSIASWYKAVENDLLTLAPNGPGKRKLVDWAAVQRYYDLGYRYTECRRYFGFSAGAWSKAVWLGLLRTRSKSIPLDRLLRESKSRVSIKRRLLSANILQNKCQECELDSWRGQPLSMQLHHMNGVRDDNRLDNLRMLCPNCHSQTATFGKRNAKKRLAGDRLSAKIDRPEHERYNS